MPFAEINLVPSVNIETTPADNPSGVQDSQFVRWKAQLVEKRGGCTLYINQQLAGKPVEIQPWAGLNGNQRVATATTERVYSYAPQEPTVRDINPTDISPTYIDQDAITPNLSVKKDENEILIYDPNVSNLTIYDSVTFNTPVSVGGIYLLGTYQVYQTSGVHKFVIYSKYPATETVTNGGILPKFTTSSGSTEITVDFPIAYQASQLQAGDTIGFDVATGVGGLIIYGQYKVARIINSTKFIIIDNENATSSESVYMNGGKISARYWITRGAALSGAGYGMNPYGGNSPGNPPPIGYGQGQQIPPITNYDTYSANDWYLDNRGPTLVANAVDGPIFFWDESSGYKNLAILAGSPVRNAGAFQAMPQGNIMAWGCSDALNPLQQPLFIRWCDSNTPTQWTPTLENNAGFYTIPTGSKIVRGIQAQTQQYWFTDVDVYVAQYVGYPNWYQFNKVGAGCGLIAPKAVGLLNSNIYWMSQKQFFVSSGGQAPQPIPCSVWDFIFQNITDADLDKVICGTNSLFNEVTWYFPSITGYDDGIDETTNPPQTAYVCYNAQYNEWDVGYIDRTAWFDQSLVGPPLGTDSRGFVYQHETSNNLAVGFNTYPMNSWFKTGYFSLQQGQDLNFVDWVLPDFKWGQYSQPQDAEMKFTFYVTDYAGQTPREYGPYSVTKDTPYISPRFRGRYIAMKVESTDIDSFWRIGSIRYRFASSGRR